MAPVIGVLALQGDVREHSRALAAIGAESREIRTPEQLDSVDALILPGGESTTISKLSRIFGMTEPIKSRIKTGMPVFGTCAGLILLANQIADGIEGQETFGGLDALVRRNAFGNQTESFEVGLDFKGIDAPQVQAAFIRAPIIESVSDDVDVLARLADGRIVAVQQGNILGISFHPEITEDFRVHEYFVRTLVGS